MELKPVRYEVGGRSFTGLLADGSGGAKVPGVLVAHESLGLTAHIKERTQRLAALGTIAFAADLFGETDLTLDQARAHSNALAGDTVELRARMRAALAVLEEHPNVDPSGLAAVGFCFGGGASIELARDGAPLAALVCFHGGVLPGADDEKIRAKVLLCHGADDPAVPPAKIIAFTEALGAAGVDWQLHLYGGVGHSFTNPGVDAFGYPGFAHDEAADRRSWAAMRDLFAEVFGDPNSARSTQSRSS